MKIREWYLNQLVTDSQIPECRIYCKTRIPRLKSCLKFAVKPRKFFGWWRKKTRRIRYTLTLSGRFSL